MRIMIRMVFKKRNRELRSISFTSTVDPEPQDLEQNLALSWAGSGNVSKLEDADRAGLVAHGSAHGLGSGGS